MIDIQQKQKTFFSPFQYGELTWLDDWREFFNPNNIIPDIHQDIPEQFNCLTRILIFLILVMYFYYGFNKYVWTLIVIFTVVIIMYLSFYKRKSYCAMKRENFETQLVQDGSSNCRTPITECSPQEPIILYDSQSPEIPILISGQNSNPSPIDVRQAHTWCYPDLILGNETASVNQKLTGNQVNPKTQAIPVIPPPMYAYDNWVPNDFVVPWKINDQRRQELYQNGYMTWDKEIPRKQVEYEMFNKYACVPDKDLKEDFSFPKYSGSDYDLPPDRSFLNATYSNQLQDMTMDTADGYYPQNAKFNYPVNVPPIPCMKDSKMSEYNKNLYSIPLQPNVYTRSQVNQPDASMYNLGISFTQPFLPTTCEMDDRGNMMIDEFDPNQYPTEYMLRGRDQYGKDDIPRHEIYDPRLTGYGTSYRSYNDPLTGQPRFYYDDIDAHTQYNYITRNKIDFTKFGPQTGPYEDVPHEDVRTLADETFHNNVMKQRTELQYRLMAKNSHREWQQRMAPLNKNNFARAQCGPPSAASYGGPRGG